MLRRSRPLASPAGLRRLALRAPLLLYRWHFGWLMGRRFLLLTHAGRSTGLPRRVVLEVVDRDDATGAFVLASGFGPGAQWYRNVVAKPEVTVQVGRWRTAAVVRPMSAEESGRAMAAYALRHPRAARALMRFCGLVVDGTWQDYYLAGRDHVPFVTLWPAGR
ncbi:nitroreductase family deazaflavin-dependent oxidoreductase [Kitasatospora indigofera]|uniref:nitroreductase family deazaflavin-dependent oxidoreductase n=1 Tax=Kitasatospora indigofera TaxID=67307 RepID=UPI003636CF82